MSTTKETKRDATIDTPWGTSQYVRPLGDAGILMVSTAGHGGVYVPNALLNKIPTEGLTDARRWSGSANWYEEDNCWAWVALAFPELFDAKMIEHARKDIARRFPNYGKPVKPPVVVKFNEAECGGAFDGFNVTSDADSGL